MKLHHSRTATLGVATLFAGALVVSTPTASHAVSFAEVTNLNDAGAGSWRQAILDANNPAMAVKAITFNIPGLASNLIAPVTDLPDIRRRSSSMGTPSRVPRRRRARARPFSRSSWTPRR